ncbi:sodium/hydrogen exchanger 8-like isoform X1 [Rhopilema esculentum]|uniref:sodium/hydrogen exchanger 8-like isoform X1 n=2 Tax=Rhopilema esculentum TaxID=499914 RepID=UPI0031E07D80
MGNKVRNILQNLKLVFSLMVFCSMLCNVSMSSINTTAQPTNFTKWSSNFSMASVKPTKHHTVKEDKMAKSIAHQSMTFFAVLLILFLCILVITFFINKKVHFVPEALAIMVLGAVIGVLIKYVIGSAGVGMKEWTDLQYFRPDTFFIVLLPPIIFESGYTLQKGDFFSNIGAILTYALLGTLLSAVIVGCTMYFLGLYGIVYKLHFMEAFSFGSLISATDPVCTLALFQTMNVDQDLYAIVFGESVLNDAVSIVLTLTLVSAAKTMESGDIVYSSIAGSAVSKFCMMLFLSAIIGVAFGLVSAVVLKYVNFKGHPSLEIGTMIIFAYMPYGLSEGLELSGIMAILLCGITMSHYTHFNLSPLSQISVQQVFRCLALIAETLVFLFLGMSIFSSEHEFDIRFISFAMLACLVARACIVFPLSLFFIFCRIKENRVSLKILSLIWFSGLRGAVAFAQSLHLPLANEEASRMIMTTTLAITVFTNVVLGGFTLPLVKLCKVESARKTNKGFVSKSLGLGKVVGPHHATKQMSQYRERNRKSPMSIIRGWRRFDRKYLIPFFIKDPTPLEYQEAVEHMIGRWVENEERTVGLLSSAEYDEFSPLLITRTRRNIIRPVRKALGVSEGRSDYESDTPASPTRRSVTNHVHINPDPEVFIAESPSEASHSYKRFDDSSETKVYV